GFGAAFIFFATGAFDMNVAAGVLNAAQAAPSAAAGLALLIAGAALLAGLAPLNAWAIGAFSRGPMFSALVLGVAAPAAGVIGLARVIAFTASAKAPGLLWGASLGLSLLGAASVVIGAVNALAAKDLRRLALHLTAVQAGCV